MEQKDLFTAARSYAANNDVNEKKGIVKKNVAIKNHHVHIKNFLVPQDYV